MMDKTRCANTEALNAYERVQDEANDRMEAIGEAVDTVIYELADKLERIVYKYEIDYSFVRKMFLENAREML